MDDLKLEKFTATDAIDAGLIQSIQRGECSVTGNYSLTDDGFLKLEQNKFIFEDKNRRIRIGIFADTYQLLNFCQEFSKLHGIEDDDAPNGIDYIAVELDEE